MSQGERTRAAAAKPKPAHADAMPLRLGTPEQFGRVRDDLRAIGFDERAVTAALKIPDIGGIANVGVKHLDHGVAGPALSAAIEFLILGETVEKDRLRTCLGETTMSALAALGLISEASHRPGAALCPVWLYPVDGFLIVSDRSRFPDGTAVPAAGDLVFPAHDAATLLFMRLLPPQGGAEALDLCGGSGIAALHLARDGSRAATADIAARSVHFAAFNAALNGSPIEVLQGDLYAAVTGRRFDIVCAHPPWVPSTGDGAVFRDGGATGEVIVERIFAGLPDHLSPGGTGIVISLGHDGRDGDYEERVRRWLGKAGADCDIILGVNRVISIDEMLDSMRNLQLRGNVDQAAEVAARLHQHGTQKFVHGAVFVRRTGARVTEPPLRLRMAADATAADFERVLAWRQRRRLPDFGDWLGQSRPRLSVHLEATYRYGLRDGVVVPRSALLTARRPLAGRVQLEVWMARLLERLDGATTVPVAFARAQQSGEMPADFTLGAFIGLAGQMVERGILDIDTSLPSDSVAQPSGC
jgi:methylase of polypeptide subunit release factors